ncbi:MAG: hypothetical protein ABIN25_00905 [Ginsengibacter sp.]
MEVEKIISGDNSVEIWKQIGEDLKSHEFSYTAVINYKGSKTFFNVEIDPGGGFEGGYQTTTLRTDLKHTGDFKFAIHHQGLLDEIGKFFGMQDIETGYAEFDKEVVVNSNDEEKVKFLFAKEQTRSAFTSITDFVFHITAHQLDESKNGTNVLELTIEEAITDSIRLQGLFNAFYVVLLVLDNWE